MTPDLDSEIAADLKAALTLRPGLDLYGVHVRPVAPFGSAGSKSCIDPAPIHRCLPDELLFKIFAKMTPYDLGKAACVCQKWEYAVRDPVFWRNACLKAWQNFGEVENYKILQSEYDGSWKKMWLLRSRVRTDGFYVNRHTYISAQFARRNVRNRVVKYSFRYLRFYPSGGLLCKTTSKKVKDLAKLMNFRASKAECVCNGHYMLSDDKVEATFFPTGLQHTVWRICLRLGGTKVGANDRMDLLSLVVDSVNDGEVPSTDEDPLFAVPDGTHIWGLAHFVFVPFEEVMEYVMLPVMLPIPKTRGQMEYCNNLVAVTQQLGSRYQRYPATETAYGMYGWKITSGFLYAEFMLEEENVCFDIAFIMSSTL